MTGRTFLTIILKAQLLCLLSVILMACEGMKNANGVVLEYPSKIPIEGVLCTVIETGEVTFTDTKGNYVAEGPFGSCMFNCKDMTIQFSKNGYSTIRILNPENPIIYLKK
jgi:hypothetical protein